MENKQGKGPGTPVRGVAIGPEDTENHSRSSFDRYSSHSIGSRYFFFELHSAQQGTTLERTLLPPLEIGTTWSIVSSFGGNTFAQ